MGKLALEKGERITMRSKSRDKFRMEATYVTEMAADTHHGWLKRAFSE